MIEQDCRFKLHTVIRPTPDCSATHHVWVVELARAGNLGEISMIVSEETEDRANALPRVRDVVPVAPDVAILCDAAIVGLYGRRLCEMWRGTAHRGAFSCCLTTG